MANPYREHMDQIQALVKRLTREHMYTTRPEERFMGEGSAYDFNFVVASAGEGFDTELDEQVLDLLKELTGEEDDSTTEDL